MAAERNYLNELKRRAKESRVYKKYQLIGLEIAKLLNDEKHKSLYIKLAKEKKAELLFGLAKEIAEKANVKNKGAYFMTCLKSTGAAPLPRAKTKTKTKSRP
jgi:hypothetical protein